MPLPAWKIWGFDLSELKFSNFAKYEALRDHIEDNFEGATVHIGNIHSFQIVLIIGCVFVATIFGADFFFMLQYPHYPWPVWARRAFEGSGIFTFGLVLTAAIGSTVVVATQSVNISGVDQDVVRQATELYFRPPVQYNRWAINIAYVVLVWVTLPCVAVSLYYMRKAALHAQLHGTGPNDDESKLSGNVNAAAQQPNTHAERVDSGSEIVSEKHVVAL
ncbi:hypothetical protein OIO90_002129 [Microbotryomycetes sp. JL221]|nr:hypothetical protein OIO90_002129 [Microbotryomycetes sp. JL221]